MTKFSRIQKFTKENIAKIPHEAGLFADVVRKENRNHIALKKPIF